MSNFYERYNKALASGQIAEPAPIIEQDQDDTYSITDYRFNPKVMRAFENVLDYLDTTNVGFDPATDPEDDDDVVEFLRDDFARIESSVGKALALKDAPESVKEDYRFLRSEFNNAEVDGFSEGVNAFLDYGTDAIVNPANATAIALGIISGATTFGAGTVATAGARAVAGKVARESLNQALKIANPTKVRGFATQGAVIGAGAMTGQQKLEIELDERNEYSPVEIAIAGALGAGIGGGLGYGLQKGSGLISNKLRQRRQVEDANVDVQTSEAADNIVRTLATATAPEKFRLAIEQAILSNPTEAARTIENVLNQATAPEKLKIAIMEAVQQQPSTAAQEIDSLLRSAVAPEKLRIALEDAIAGPSVAAQNFENGMRELVSGSVREAEALGAAEFGEKMKALLGATTDDLDQIINNLATKVSERGESLEVTGVEDLAEIDELVERIGGGPDTYAQVVDAAIAAAGRNAPPAVIRNTFLNNLNKIYTRFTSSVSFGKSAGFLDPYTDISPTAKLLKEKINTEYGMGWKPGQKLIEEDYGGTARLFTNRFFDIFREAILPIATKRYNGGLSEAVNNDLSLALRGQSSKDQEHSQAVNVAARQIRNAYRVAGKILAREGFITIQDNYVPRQWKRSAIAEDFGNGDPNAPNEFAKLLIKAGEAKDMNEALSIVKSMLDKKNQLTGGGGNYFFSANRKFENITNDAEFEKFLNNDVKATFYNYMEVAGRALAKKKVFGVRQFGENGGFNQKWIEQISREVEAATGKALPLDAKQRIKNLYQTITSESIDGDDVQAKKKYHEGYELLTRIGLLPFATVSSLTEIMLNLGVAGGVKSAKGIAAAHKIGLGKATDDWNALTDAMNLSFLKITKNTHQELQDQFGLTPNEAWREMQSVGLVMEQQLASMADRLAGEELTTEWMQNTSNRFFRFILLDQWTKMVQNTSFQTGKIMIKDHLLDLAEHGSAQMTRRMQSKLDDLAELGVDVERGKAWIASGADKNADFYRDIVEGAARYTNQIILQPDRASGLKPRFQYTPTGSVLFALMGYPTAFTNNILKRGGKRLVRDKEMAAAKLVPAAIAMTATAGFTNYVRNRGEGYDEKNAPEIMYEAMARWGGNGLPFDNIMRVRSNVENDGLVGIPAAFMGPLYGELVDLAQYRKPIMTIGTKLTPFYGAIKPVLGEEAQRSYRRSLGKIDETLTEAITGETPRTPFKKGGEVNVPQAPKEPDERIDKMTGLPYNTQAGTAFIDEEDFPRSLLTRTE
jgi:hypothetical protein